MESGTVAGGSWWGSDGATRGVYDSETRKSQIQGLPKHCLGTQWEEMVSKHRSRKEGRGMAQCECLQNMQEDLGLISSFKIKGKQTLLAAMKKREKEELILEGLVLFCFVFFLTGKSLSTKLMKHWTRG